MKKIPNNFFLHHDVVDLAKKLIGKVLCSNINNQLVKVIIIETEAYAGAEDKASHAYGGKYTNRTKTMYNEGGVAYIYLCYGIHYLFNIVTNKTGVPHAILIRGGIPFFGINTIIERRKKTINEKNLLIGPGKLSQGLGISMLHNNISLTGDTIWLEDHQLKFNSSAIKSTPRIGIDYADEDKHLPFRFVIEPKHINL